MRRPTRRTSCTVFAVSVALAGLAVAPAADAKGGRHKLTSTLDGKKTLPARTRWLARPPGKASAVKEVRFFIDGKVRQVELKAPFTYGGDDGLGHLGWLVTSWLSPGRHRFTTQALLKGGRKLSDTVVARVVKAPKPPTTLAGRWRRSFTAADLDRIAPGLSGFVPAGTWDLIFDRAGAWELDPLGTGIGEHVRFHDDTIRNDAPIAMAPFVNNHTGVLRYGREIGGRFCRDDGPVGTYRWSVTNDQLTLTPINEPCLQRRGVWAGTWTRVG
jgi:hypothetical protein